MFEKFIINKTVFAYLLTMIIIILTFFIASSNSLSKASKNLSKKLDYMYLEEKKLKKELKECKEGQRGDANATKSSTLHHSKSPPTLK